MTPPLTGSLLGRHRLPAAALVVALAVAISAAFLAIPATSAQSGPNLTCSDLGFDLLAKYNFVDGAWQFEDIEGTSDIITFATPHDPQDQAWTSSVPIGTIILKGAAEDEAVLNVGGAMSGTFVSPFLNAIGEVQDISHVEFCAGQAQTPTNTPTPEETVAGETPVVNTPTNTPTPEETVAGETPVNTPTNTPTPEETVAGETPVNTPTPIDSVLGVETPGTTPTPIVGSTGTGLQSQGSSSNLVVAMLGLLALTAGGALLVAGRRSSGS